MKDLAMAKIFAKRAGIFSLNPYTLSSSLSPYIDKEVSSFAILACKNSDHSCQYKNKTSKAIFPKGSYLPGI